MRTVPVTIPHAACDLAGVAISGRNRGGAAVPHGGGGTGIGNSGGLELTVRPGTLDVAITVTGPPGRRAARSTARAQVTRQDGAGRPVQPGAGRPGGRAAVPGRVRFPTARACP